MNGIHRGAIGIPLDNESRLNIVYDSGEKISANYNAGPVLRGEENIDIYDFFLDLATAENPDHMKRDEYTWEPHKVLKGKYRSEDGNHAIDFSNYYSRKIKIYEKEELSQEAPYIISGEEVHCNKVGVDGKFDSYRYFRWDGTNIIGRRLEGENVIFVKAEE